MTTTIGGIRVSTDMQADRYGSDRQHDDLTGKADRVGLVITAYVEGTIAGKTSRQLT